VRHRSERPVACTAQGPQPEVRRKSTWHGSPVTGKRTFTCDTAIALQWCGAPVGSCEEGACPRRRFIMACPPPSAWAAHPRVLSSRGYQPGPRLKNLFRAKPAAKVSHGYLAPSNGQQIGSTCSEQGKRWGGGRPFACFLPATSPKAHACTRSRFESALPNPTPPDRVYVLRIPSCSPSESGNSTAPARCDQCAQSAPR
jgi:hypothetical protein